MLKKVLLFDLIIALLANLFILQVNKSYAMFFLLGLLLAAISFVLTTWATRKYMSSFSGKSGAIMYITNFVKILVICIIGALIFNNKVYNVIFYICGYTSHFLALILFGIVNLLNERK